MPKKAQVGDWFPDFLENLNNREQITDSNILDQVNQDQGAEEVIETVLQRMPQNERFHSPARLSRVLEQMGKLDLYDNVYNILTKQHNMRFKKIQRRRGRGRRGR